MRGKDHRSQGQEQHWMEGGHRKRPEEEHTPGTSTAAGVFTTPCENITSSPTPGPTHAISASIREWTG